MIRPGARTLALSAMLAVAACHGAGGTAFAAEVAPSAHKPQLVPATADQVLQAVRESAARVVVVNLWATWCTPCRAEFPDLMRFHRDYKDRGVALVLVSGDFASDAAPAREFLASQGVDFRTFLKSQQDEAFINALDPAWSGALPATFVYDSKGGRRHSFLGSVTYQALEQQVLPLLEAEP